MARECDTMLDGTTPITRCKSYKHIQVIGSNIPCPIGVFITRKWCNCKKSGSLTFSWTQPKADCEPLDYGCDPYVYDYKLRLPITRIRAKFVFFYREGTVRTDTVLHLDGMVEDGQKNHKYFAFLIVSNSISPKCN